MIIKYLIHVIISCQCVNCALQNVVQTRIKQLRTESERLYGSATNLLPESWKTSYHMSYPGNNKQKLAYISEQWLRYYECSNQLLNSLTQRQTLPSKIVVAYEEAVARVTCGLCVAPDEKNKLIWMYAKSTNQTLTQLKQKSTTVRDAVGNLTIYLVKKEDSGVYKCHIGKSVGGLVILEVLDENYRLVKPKSSLGPYSEPARNLNQTLMLYSVWSPWSECSKCDTVGRRRRFGMCFVKICERGNQINKECSNEPGNDTVMHPNILDAFVDFPSGIPCRSQYLPVTIRELNSVQTRPNEIMLGLCRMRCKEIVLNLNFFREFERDINNASELSILHPLPPQPPPPSATFIFVDKGKPLILTCAGSTLRDVPYTWRIGNKEFIPQAHNEKSSGRISLNARDQLVFTRVEYSDTNLYSCWQTDALCSSIKLKVECGVEQDCRRYALTLTAIVIAATLLRILVLLED